METTALQMFTDTVKETDNMIWVRPLCDFFQIDVQNQYTKIKNDPILGKLYGKNSTDLVQNEKLYGKNSTDFGINDKNGRILLTKKGFIRWIQIINPNIIPFQLLDQFIEYQEKIADFLFGSVEEHEMISAANNRLQNLKGQYSQLGNEIRRTQGELQQLLNNRYQYRLPFTAAKTIEKQ
jgi:hypothetical protein